MNRPRRFPYRTFEQLEPSRKRWLAARWGVYRRDHLAAKLNASPCTVTVWGRRLGLPPLDRRGRPSGYTGDAR